MKAILVIVVCSYVNPIQSGDCKIATFSLPSAEDCQATRMKMERLLENRSIVYHTECHGGEA